MPENVTCESLQLFTLIQEQMSLDKSHNKNEHRCWFVIEQVNNRTDIWFEIQGFIWRNKLNNSHT